MSESKHKRPSRLSSLSIVLPAYNEEMNIALAVTGALRSASTVTENYEVTVVNDGSTDKTAMLVQELTQQFPKHVQLINNPKNLGYGPTVRRGLKSGQKDWVFFTDADGQFDIDEIAKLVPYTEKYDFIVGRRRKRQDPLNRKLNAGLFNAAVRLFFGIRVKDVDCAFKLMRRSKLHSFDLVSESAMINTELLHKARKVGVTIKEVDVTHRKRLLGEPTGANSGVVLKAVKEFYTLRYHLFRESWSKR